MLHFNQIDTQAKPPKKRKSLFWIAGCMAFLLSFAAYGNLANLDLPSLSWLSDTESIKDKVLNNPTSTQEAKNSFTLVPEIAADKEEIIFSAVSRVTGNGQEQSFPEHTLDAQTITISNNGTTDLIISAVTLSDTRYTLTSTHTFPITLNAGQDQIFEITFTPVEAEAGQFNGILTFVSNDVSNPNLEVNLYGLSANRFGGTGEPPLQTIVNVLGYNINVGWTGLTFQPFPFNGSDEALENGLINMSTDLYGDEVVAQLFKKVGNSTVTLTPVARYSPLEDLPTGWYTLNEGTPVLNELFILEEPKPEHQTLFPEMKPGGTMTFDPQEEVFGVYMTSEVFGRTSYTQDVLNEPSATPSYMDPSQGSRHRVRVYPINDRQGVPVANTYVLCFEDANNGDYQDYMYVLSGVEPATAPLAPVTFTRINANGPEYTDTQSNVWAADNFFTASSTGTRTFDIAGTNDDELFRRYRFANNGAPFSCDIPVSDNGIYNVRVLMMEPYFGAPGGGSNQGGPGRRVFNINVENGQGVLNNYDLNADVGPATASTKTFTGINVTDGVINIEFTSVTNNAIVSAIEVSGPYPPSLVFQAANNSAILPVGGSTNLSATVLTTNGSTNQNIKLTALDAVSFDPITWLTINGLPLNNLDFTTDTNFDFEINSAGLAAGTYTASVTATADDLEAANILITLTVTPPQSDDAFFTGPTPPNGATGVPVNSFQITVLVVTPNNYELTSTTLSGNVNLYEVVGANEVLVPSNSNDTAGGDAITLTPTSPLKPFTTYRLRLEGIEANRIGDLNDRIAFQNFLTSFTTGGANSGGTGLLPGISFTKVQGTALGAGTNDRFTTLEIGPDGKLYGVTVSGEIKRWVIEADGTLSNLEVLTPVLTASPNPETGITDANPRLIIGFTFDKNATADNLIAYITHSAAVLTDAPSWDGKVTQLSGPNLTTVKDVVIHLPRSVKDHLVNSIVRGPDGALYISQGSNTAGGDPDAAWGNRPERLLAGAILKLDLSKLPEANWPLDAYTTSNINVINNAPSGSILMSDGTYNPYATNSPLTIFSAGIRNAYDLVWHSNGKLYVPTNGTAGNNVTSPNTPATDNYITPANGNRARRIDGTYYQYPTFPNVPAVFGGETQKDWLFIASQGSYHGHPNPYQGSFVLNHGGITYDGIPGQTQPHVDVAKYPASVQPDPAYVAPAYDFGFNKSPNGAIEYKSNAFGGTLRNKLLITRFSGQNDLIVLEPDNTTGAIVNAYAGMTGITNFVDPLDLIEDTRNGNIYVAQYDRNGNTSQQIVLLRADVPATDAPEIAVDKNVLHINDPINNVGGTTQTLVLNNVGNSDLEINNVSIIGTKAARFSVAGGQTSFTIAPNTSVNLSIVFNAASAADLGNNLAELRISSNHLGNSNFTTVVNLRGLGTQGVGGTNEPSLQAILNVYNIPVNVGDDAPTTNVLHSTIQDGSLLGEEVSIQKFEKATTAPVEVELLSVFGPTASNPIVNLGWYQSGNTSTELQLLSVGNVPTNNGQSINPTFTGTTSFSPEMGQAFGLYSEWAFFGNRKIYSEDALNTFNEAIPHHVRVYPMKNTSGQVVANQYIVAFEEHTVGFDYQDIVLLVKNVKPFEEVALPQIVFTPSSKNLVLEQGTSASTWLSLNVPGATNAELTFTAIDPSTGTTPTWLSSTAFNWGEVYNYNATLPALPLNIDGSTFTFGNYEATITVAGAGYSNSTFTLTLEVVPAINWTYHINFQREQDAVPVGFISDTGLPFGEQVKNGETYTFGWLDPITNLPKDNTARTRLRTGGGFPLELRSLNQFQNGSPTANWANWAINIPNNTYYVKIGSGDNQFFDSQHRIGAEGEEVLFFPQASVQTAAGQPGYFETISEVNVADGQLNIAPIGNGNSKISYIMVGTPGLADVRLAFDSLSLNRTVLFNSGANVFNTILSATAGVPNISLEVISGMTWLSVPANVSVGNLAITANINNLALGDYQGRIRASAPGYQSVDLVVNIKVLPQTLTFNTQVLRFNTNQGTNPPAQTATLTTSVGTPIITLSKPSGVAWLDIPANPTVGIAQNYTINTAGLAPGMYTATVTASAQGYTDAQINVFLKVMTVPTGTWAYQINFQKDPTPLPAGYIPDLGDPYGTRTFGGTDYEFGWIDVQDGSPYDNRAQSRRRNSGPEILRTLNQFQSSANANVRANWEIALPNDTYDVLISVGEIQFRDSRHLIRVEDVFFMEFDQELWGVNNANLIVEKTIEVTDGKLTLNGQTGINSKIQYIWIRPNNPANDNIPPSVRVTFEGTELSQNVFKNEVVVRAFASDEGGSGVALTEFSIDNGTTWQPYLNSLLIDEEGDYNLRFRVTDGNGNTTQTPLYSIRVERVPLNNTKMVLENRDRFPENDELTFQRIQETGWPQSSGGVAEFHDFVTLRVNNRGLQPLNVFDLVLSNEAYWQIETINGVAYNRNQLPLTIGSNQFADVGLRFIAVEPPNPRSNGVKVLHETLTIISNDDEMPIKDVKLHGLWQRRGEGGNEPMASEILDAFGLTIDIAFPSPNFKAGDDFSVAGDEIYTNNFLRADPNKPVIIRQLAAYHGCCDGGAGSWTQENNPDANGGRVGNVGIRRTNHIGADSQTLLPRRDRTGPVGTLGDPAEGEFNPNGKFNVTLGGRDCINPALNFQQLVGTRIWKLRNSKGEIVPFAFILANDYLSANANFDYNDNVFLITNVRPEFGTGYASVLATGNGVANDPAERQSDIDFGQVAIENANSTTLNLRSLGQVYPEEDDPDIIIDFVEIVGQNRGEFFADMPSKSILKPTEATTMQVHFNPQEAGAKHATLLIHYNSDQSPMRVPLYGIATSDCEDLLLRRKIKTAAPDANPMTIGGEEWESDVPFRVAGINYKLDVFNDAVVSLTDRDELYNRYMSSQGTQNGRRIEYAIPVANGNYTVRMHFAEIFWSNINSRVNDILIEGNIVLQGFDAFSEIGRRAAMVKDFNVSVTDGVLDLRFNPLVDRPSIAGIEIFQFDDASPLDLQLVASTNADCNTTNGSLEVVATGNTNPVVYKLGKFGTYQTSATFSNLEPGEYTIYAKEDVANACETEARFVVGENPSAITFDISTTPVSCDGGNNGTAQVSNFDGGAAPYRVFWNGNPVQGTVLLENLAAGNYTVRVVDANDCEVSQNFEVVGDPTCPSTVRIQAGNTAAPFTDNNGNVFMADAYFSTPSNTSNSGNNIINSPNNQLYQRQRWRNGNFNYAIPVTNNLYKVVLHFAELFDHNGTVAAGSRVFNVDIEGERKLTDFDVFAQAGGMNIAITREFIVDVQDGFVNINFIKGLAENPMISAIEVLPYTVPVNLPPVANQVIPNQTANQGVAYNYQVSNFAFIDGDDATLTLSATLANGDPLPVWLTFNPATRRFTGTPDAGDVGDFEIRVTATDSQGQSVSQTFTLSVIGTISVVVNQNNRPLVEGANNKAMIVVQLTGTAGQLLNSLTFNTNGTSELNSIKRAKVFTTNGTAFVRVQQIGNTVSNPNGEFTIDGLNHTLLEGVNYFWLAYDIADQVAPNSLFDAELLSLNLGGTVYPINNGSPIGARIVRTTERTPGKLLAFNGLNEYVSINREEYFDFEDDFSIEFWMKVGAFDKENQAIITKGNSAWRLQRFGVSNQIQFIIEGVDNVVSTTELNDNEWHHITATYTGTEMILYIDGKVEEQKNVFGTPATNNLPVWIGANAEVANLNFNGRIDELRVWNTVRTQTQVRECRHITLKGNEEGLLAYFQFNENFGGVSEDITEGFTATLNNMNVAERPEATEPVGGGIVGIANSQASANVVFGQTGLNIVFGANHPQGEIVVTRIIGLTPAGDDPAPGKGKTPDYWIINNYGSDDNLSPMQFEFEMEEGFLLSANPEDYKLYKRGANDFQNWPNNFEAVTVNDNQIAFGGLTGFSQVIIAGDGIGLPVSLLSFEGSRLDNNQVELKWTTVSEQDNRGFEIEKSQDALNFTSIGFVEGAGNSVQLRNYSFIDVNATEKAYYRLKQVDFDGTATLSNVIFIDASTTESTLRVYPNPYQGFENITIEASEDVREQDRISMQVLDMRGTLVSEAQGELKELEAKLTQQLRTAAAGQYIVRFFTKDKNFVIKMIRK